MRPIDGRHPVTFNGHRRNLSGWGRYSYQTCSVVSPTSPELLIRAVGRREAPNLIARGLGRSYGDSAQNDRGQVIVQTRLNRFLAFDESTGILECEAGVNLAEIIDTFLPRGWFLPTSPGTKFAPGTNR